MSKELPLSDEELRAYVQEGTEEMRSMATELLEYRNSLSVAARNHGIPIPQPDSPMAQVLIQNNLLRKEYNDIIIGLLGARKPGSVSSN